MFTIRTSEDGWLSKLSMAYRNHEPISLIDDAHVGVDPANQTIFDMGKCSGATIEEWMAVGISLGMSGAGMWMIYLATKDPEPTTRLGLLTAGGAICVMGGGFSAIYILTKNKPPSVEVNKDGTFRIAWE